MCPRVLVLLHGAAEVILKSWERGREGGSREGKKGRDGGRERDRETGGARRKELMTLRRSLSQECILTVGESQGC